MTDHDYEEGVIGFESARPGQQTGHLVTAQSPSWAGVVQCDTCNLPRQYPSNVDYRFSVDERGEIACDRCRRMRWVRAPEWYPITLRIFQPPAKEGDLPRRVIPRAAFELSRAMWPRPGQKRLRNAFLHGYAEQILDGLPRPASIGDTAPPKGIDDPAGVAYNRAWMHGRIAAEGSDT